MPDSTYNNVYNPDVLSCLANLSNDEVLTPPCIANAMLDMLPQDVGRQIKVPQNVPDKSSERFQGVRCRREEPWNVPWVCCFAEGRPVYG